jgi:hypothetical protein
MRAIRRSRRLGRRNSWPILAGIAVLSLPVCAWLLALHMSTKDPVIIDEAAKLNACRASAITLIKQTSGSLLMSLIIVTDRCVERIYLATSTLGNLVLRSSNRILECCYGWSRRSPLPACCFPDFSCWLPIDWRTMVGGSSPKEESLALIQKASRLNHQSPASLF